jgi:hypothetical protein
MAKRSLRGVDLGALTFAVDTFFALMESQKENQTRRFIEQFNQLLVHFFGLHEVFEGLVEIVE